MQTEEIFVSCLFVFIVALIGFVLVDMELRCRENKKGNRNGSPTKMTRYYKCTCKRCGTHFEIVTLQNALDTSTTCISCSSKIDLLDPLWATSISKTEYNKLHTGGKEDETV